MKTSNYFFILALLFLASCSGDDDSSSEPTNEEEEITRVTITASLTSGIGTDRTFDYIVTDSGIEVDDIILEANSTYTLIASFWNDEENPAENVTEEIIQEADEHLTCYDLSNSVNATYMVTDTDSNGLPLGLDTDWETMAASTGTLTLTLKHQPDIKSDPVDCNAGETDVMAQFPIRIE